MRHQAWLLSSALITSVWLASLVPASADTNSPGAITAEIKSPVDEFRKLLVMPLDIRQKFLAKQSELKRQRIMEKIREYAALKPEERLARLQATEMSWYLLPLLGAPATNRTAQLALIPSAKRPLVEARLRQWDSLPPVTQQTLLTNRQAIPYLMRVGSAPKPSLAGADDIRQKVKDRLDQLVKLKEEEKTKVLRVLPDAERHQMEKTLQTFEKLPADQRERCLAAFAKFATLSRPEQQEFLNNAQHWSQLSAAERQTWRELVGKLSEPPPPG